MIRPFTCVCMILACASGLYLYQTKHRAQMLDHEIARTMKLAEDARARTGVLRAEWALLNEPGRLSELAARHLNLATMAPGQFVALADLGQRLPPPGALPKTEPADVEVPAPVAQAAQVEAARPSPTLAGIIPTAEAATSQPERPIVMAQAKRREPYAATGYAPAAYVGDPSRDVIIQQSLPPPAHVVAAPVVVRHVNTPKPAAPRPVFLPAPHPAAPYVARATAPIAAPATLPIVTASALGASRSALPPPVPFSPAQAPR